jgi:phosphohistidine phosphatase
MTKTLILFRHAHSDWETPHSTDHQRGISQEGVIAAKKMGYFLSQTQLLPELAITSSATRAQRTLYLAIAKGSWSNEIKVNDELYLPHAATVFNLIRNLDNQYHNVLLVGHNPVWRELTFGLTGMRVRFPNAAMIVMHFDAENWGDIQAEGGTVRMYIEPEDIQMV